MSAWAIGRQNGAQSLSSDPQGLKAFVDRVVQWIPGDVIAIYTVGITTLRTQDPDPNPSPLWLLIAGALSFILVLLAAQRTRKKIQAGDFGLAVLSVIAFGIWTLAIPDSGWQDWYVVAGNPGWVALIAALGGLLFGAIVDTFLGD